MQDAGKLVLRVAAIGLVFAAACFGYMSYQLVGERGGPGSELVALFMQACTLIPALGLLLAALAVWSISNRSGG